MRAMRGLVVAIFLGRVALAQTPNGNLTAANALFDQGKQLTAEGHLAEACARFEKSLALITQLGVQLNLADCKERLGKTATAWLAFGEAAALARRQNDMPSWKYAQRRREALKPRLCRLIVAIASSAGAVSVSLDDAPLSPDAYGVEIPVDPGEHSIGAAAPGRIPSETRVTLSRRGEVITVMIPELAPAPQTAAANPAIALEPPARERSAEASPAVSAASDRRKPTPGTWVAAGVGIASAGLGVWFGLSARAVARGPAGLR